MIYNLKTVPHYGTSPVGGGCTMVDLPTGLAGMLRMIGVAEEFGLV
jgi:hypothetical protein